MVPRKFGFKNCRVGSSRRMFGAKYFFVIVILCSLTCFDSAAEGSDPKSLPQEVHETPSSSEGGEQDWVSDKGGTLSQNVTGGFGDFLLKFKDTITIGISVEEKFDDNIFNTWGAKRDLDFITTLTPKANFKIGKEFFDGILTGSNSAKFEVGEVPLADISLDLNLEYYARHPKENSTSNPDSFLQPKVSVELNPDDNLYLELMIDTSRTNLSQIDPLNKGKSRKKVVQTTVRYGMTYTFGPPREPLVFSYEHTDTDNGDNESADNQVQNDWSLTFTVPHENSRLAKLFCEYDGQGSDNSGSEKVTHNFFVGLKGKFSPKITGTAKVGYGFDVPGSNIFSFSHATGDMVATLDWTYVITPRFSCTLDVERSLKDVTFFSVDGRGEDEAGEEGQRSTLNVPRQLRESLNLAVGFTYTPPFFMENLTLHGRASQREIAYSDGSRNKVRDLSLGYDYVWRNKDRSLGQAWWSSDWKASGEIQTRLQSPNTGWEKYLDSVVSLKLTMEF